MLETQRPQPAPDAVDLKDLSRRLFKTAETLWINTGLRPDQYPQPVLALIAPRQIEAKFLLVDAALKPRITGRLKPTPDAYEAAGAMFMPEIARVSRLPALPTATPRSAVPMIPLAALPTLPPS